MRSTPSMLRRWQRAGFSLIECALALGVVSFAFVALVGLIPVGLNNFNNAIDSTIGAQIAQGVMTEVRQAKFSRLADFNRNPDSDPLKPSADYFYDEEGTTTPTTTKDNYVYSAAVQIFYTDKVDIGVVPALANGKPDTANLAVIRVIVKRISAPNQSKEFTGFVANNGL
jgi:uncharacterized protein (TIGR02598 family)